MNRQLTAEDMAKVAAAEVAAARRCNWYAATWKHLDQPKPVYCRRDETPERDRVLIAIARGCKTRRDIIETIGKSKEAVGGQCNKLLHHGLVEADKVGNVHYYRLTKAGRKAARDLGE